MAKRGSTEWKQNVANGLNNRSPFEMNEWRRKLSQNHRGHPAGCLCAAHERAHSVCINGHPFTKENSRYSPANRGKTCKECGRQRAREATRRVKQEILSHYGGKCVCCGETTFEFLCIDHINGGGTAHRKEVGSGTPFYRWLRKTYPSGYQVLCHNCNQAKGFYGSCPHAR